MKNFLAYLKAAVSAAILVMECLPTSAMLISRWPKADNSGWVTDKRYYSYIDPVVYLGGADFLKPATVILTVLILLLCIKNIFKETRNATKTILGLSIAAALSSLPIMYGIYSYTVIGICITLLLVIMILLSSLGLKKNNP